MPTEYQKIMDQVLQKHRNTFAFIADILIVTTGTSEQHLKKAEEVLGTSNEAGARLKLEKMPYEKNRHRMAWLQVFEKDIEPVEVKLQGKTDQLSKAEQP